MFVVENFFTALASVVYYVLELYIYVVVARALISWVNPEPDRAVFGPSDRTGFGSDPEAHRVAFGYRFFAFCPYSYLDISAEVHCAVACSDGRYDWVGDQYRGDAMKITPLDIQQMVFRVKLRGFDQEEVNRFLEEVAQTVESLSRDNVGLRERIITLEHQVSDLKRTEQTLSNTLVSAQSLADDVKRSAQRDAELIVKEAELKAGELFRQARVELADTQRDVSMLYKQRLLMVERMRATLHTFERMLDVEASEAYQDSGVASEDKMQGESSSAR